MTTELAEAINKATRLAARALRVALVGRVESFNSSTNTATVLPLQWDTVETRDGEVEQALPLLPGVPVFSLYGYTEPLVGRECLLIACDRSLDVWHARGSGAGSADTRDARRHSLSDCVALVGLHSADKRLTEWPQDRVQIGSQSGPRVAVTDTAVHLGVPSGINSTEPAALANAVRAELQALRATVEALVTAFNSHTHVVPGGTSAVPVPLAVGPAPVGPVACEKVFIR